MRKAMKKAAAVSLAAVMSASVLAACGGSESSSQATSSSGAESTGNESTSDAAEFTDYSAGFPEQVTIQIPVYDRGFEGWNVTDNYYTQWIQKEFGDKYNVKVEYVAISRSNEVQDYMQMIAAGTAPDIIYHYDMPQAVAYYNEGAIQPVNYDEVAFYAPTFWENMQETIETYGKLDGENAFIFAARNPNQYNYVTVIRKDWLDKVDMEVPTTLEEMTEVAKAWKEAGLGTIGVDLWQKSFTFEYPFIGESVDPDDASLYLDLNVAPMTWDVTKACLQAYNSLYNEGLLDSEFYLNTDDAAWKAKFVSGEVGTYAFYISKNTDVFSSLKANDPNAEVAFVSGYNVPSNSHAYYYEYPAYGMIMGINNTTSDEERAAVYMFLDWMSQSENLTFLQNGVEGENYTVNEDGLPVPVAGFEGESKLSNNNNKDYWCLVQETVDYGDEEMNLKSNIMNIAPEGYEFLVQDAYDSFFKNLDYGIVSTIYTKAVESSAEYSADLKALWVEGYVKCVTCKPEEFEATYEEYCQEYLDAGYQEILDEKQSLLGEGAYIKMD